MLKTLKQIRIPVIKKFTENILVLSLGVFFLSSCSGKSEIFSTSEGAINGYDVVSYFHENKPVKGNKNYIHEWKSATWHFSSEENLNLFKSRPEMYAPQYGGYCAFGTAEGHKAPTEPDAWSIVKDKLYFNYNKEVQAGWNNNKEELIKKADQNWPDVKSQNF